MFIRSLDNYDRDEASIDSGITNTEKSLTQQNQKEESDINNIVRKFGLTGQLPSNLRVPQYGDFSDITDYQSALNAVMKADEAFFKLPAQIRSRFENDPEQFVEFCLDDNNRAEAEKLGLVIKKEPAVSGGVTPTETGGKNDTPALVKAPD